MVTIHRWLTLGIALALCGCAAIETEKEPLQITPKSEVASSPVVREVLPPPIAAPSAPAPQPSATTNPEAGGAPPTLAKVAPALTMPKPWAAPPIAVPPRVPPGTLYVCTGMVNGELQQTAIEFEPRVRNICSRHPEMGVCQYEREACRASGGRVHTVTGVEITRQTEAEYDKKVLRVRFRAG